MLQEASRAQEYEDEGDLGLAIEAYYRAARQLSYFVDLHVEKGTALADLCEGLGQQYEQRATVSGLRLSLARADCQKEAPTTNLIDQCQHRHACLRPWQCARKSLPAYAEAPNVISPQHALCWCYCLTGPAQQARSQGPPLAAA